jgi:hypothetical protein
MLCLDLPCLDRTSALAAHRVRQAGAEPMAMPVDGSKAQLISAMPDGCVFFWPGDENDPGAVSKRGERLGDLKKELQRAEKGLERTRENKKLAQEVREADRTSPRSQLSRLAAHLVAHQPWSPDHGLAWQAASRSEDTLRQTTEHCAKVTAQRDEKRKAHLVATESIKTARANLHDAKAHLSR